MKNTIENIKEFARQVKEILGENLVQVILYGSYAVVIIRKIPI